MTYLGVDSLQFGGIRVAEIFGIADLLVNSHGLERGERER